MLDGIEFKRVERIGETEVKEDYISILKEIFYKGKEEDYERESKVLFSEDTATILYVVYQNRVPVGITGVYWGDEEGICWLNWYGVLEKYRGKGYGSFIFNATIELAKGYFKGIRLWTDDTCGIAVKYVYDGYFPVKEEFEGAIIYSKSFIKGYELQPYRRTPYGKE